MKVEILGVKIDDLTMEEALQKIEGFLTDGQQHYIVTPNPEFLVLAQKDKKFRQILNQADLAVPDGVGLIFASWFLGRPLKQKIAGTDLMERICQKAVQKKWPVFLIGGEEEVAEKAGENLKKKYSELQIGTVFRSEDSGTVPLGASSDEDTPDETVPSSLSEGQSLLFVALGMPKQEKWINENLKKMPSVKLVMGVGGAFDFIAGQVPRAPKFLRAISLEWLWRFFYQPWRIKRIFKAVIVFPYLVIRSVF